MSNHAVSVFGSSRVQRGSPTYQQAYEVGQRLAQAGFIVINGGYFGTMEAVSRGARDAGGTVIGITCAVFDGTRSGGNPYLSVEEKAPDLLERLRALTSRADAYIVLHGGIGTLLELALVWNLRIIGAMPPKPCIALGTAWEQVLATLQRELLISPEEIALWHIAHTPAEAVAYIQTALTSPS